MQDPVWTATAARADIVLPASTSIERNDIAGNRRSNHIIAMQQAIMPLGSSRSDYDIFRAVAGRLGVESDFSEGRDEIGWIRHIYDGTRQDAHERLGYQMPDFDLFWSEGAASVPIRQGYVYLDVFRRDPATAPLQTESGRIVLTSQKLARLGYADCRSYPSWIEPAEWLGDRVATARWPFHLISHQPSGRLHSQLVQEAASAETRRHGREQLTMNPRDAERLDITEGCLVRVWNRRGQSLAVATLRESVRPGVLVLPTGSWYEPLNDEDGAIDLAGNPNLLTLDKGTSRFGQGCSAQTCLVTVEVVQDDEIPEPSLKGAPPASTLVRGPP